jgi:hypothetical protein
MEGDLQASVPEGEENGVDRGERLRMIHDGEQARGEGCRIVPAAGLRSKAICLRDLRNSVLGSAQGRGAWESWEAHPEAAR